MIGKKTGALLLAMVLVAGSMAACGNSEGSDAGNAAQGNTEAADTSAGAGESTADGSTEAASDSNASGGDAAASGTYNVTWDDMEDIIVVYPSMGAIPTGLQEVEDAINEITEAEINTHVTLNMIEVGNYDQQMNLMISSSEPVDLMITLPGGTTALSAMTSQKQLMDITDLLSEYAPEALAGVGDVIKGTQLDGGTYAFPAYRSFSSAIYINMRTDVLEDLGLVEKAENMTSFSEFEEILQAVADSEDWATLSPIVNNDATGSVLPYSTTVNYTENFADITDFDSLGGTFVGVDLSQDASEVVNLYATEAFKNNYELVKGWYDNGWVYKDAATSSDMGAELVKANVGFSYIAMTERGSESATDTSCGMPMTKVAIHEMPITTSMVTKFTWAVPNSSKAPEAAVTFLEMMFKDSRIANLMAWGIEGRDYEINADGVACYIEGNETPAYHSADFLTANAFVVTPWDGSDPDLRDQQRDYMEASPISRYLGFACDTTDVTNEITAMTNAVSEYGPQINSGMADETAFNDFLAKMEAGNVQAIIDHYQTNLDSWEASNQ